MKYQKGQSGNPGGRKKMSDEDKERWEALAHKSLDRMEKLLEATDTPPNIVTKIAEIAANRAWGLPHQSVGLEDPEGNPVALTIKYVD